MYATVDHNTIVCVFVYMAIICVYVCVVCQALCMMRTYVACLVTILPPSFLSHLSSFLLSLCSLSLYLPTASTCSDISVGRNVEVTQTNRNFVYSVAIHACHEGYRLHGNQIRECQPSGIWSGGPPSCIREFPHILLPTLAKFALLHLFPYLSISLVSTQTLAISLPIFISLPVLYSLPLFPQTMQIFLPPYLSTLLPSLSPSLPLHPTPHTAIVCPPIYAPNNGNFSLSDRTCYRSEAVYTCNEGYILSGGDMIRTCQDTMLWSGREPCCVRATGKPLTSHTI